MGIRKLQNCITDQQIPGELKAGIRLQKNMQCSDEIAM